MVTNFKQMLEGFFVEKGRDETTGQSVYFYDDSQPTWDDDLPVVDEPHPDEPGITVARVRRTKLVSGTSSAALDGKEKYVVTYSKPEEDEPPELLPRRMTLGGEMQNIGSNSMFWFSDQKTIDQPLFRVVINGTWIITEAITDRVARMAELLTIFGKVNDAAWDGFHTEILLYIGSSWTEKQDKDGNTKWLVDHNFAIRTVTGDFTETGGVSDDGWNFVWREDNNTWDRPDISIGPAGIGIYLTTDFDTVFPLAGV